MCMGIPQQIRKVDGIAGHVMGDAGPELVDLSLTPDAREGDWVLNFLGAARAILTEDEALKIRAALQGLSALMQGGDLGAAFADLDARSPSLPPHLQAALEAGQTTG